MMLREITFDLETTGLKAQDHRVAEIGCVELCDRVPTGRTFQAYVNPEQAMPEAAYRIHGLSDAFLRQYPPFEKVVDALLDFVEESTLVIHNAPFDMSFLNAELARLGRAPVSVNVVDTIPLARKKFPGSLVNLDVLCNRFHIDRSSRTKHGALLDAQLLCEVYIHLLGGRQTSLDLSFDTKKSQAKGAPRKKRPPRPHAPTDQELALHKQLVEGLPSSFWPLVESANEKK